MILFIFIFYISELKLAKFFHEVLDEEGNPEGPLSPK